VRNSVTVGNVPIGGDGDPLAVLAGPCVIESRELCMSIAAQAKEICAKLGLGYVFKASFDKANRTGGKSFRGLGMDEGLDVLRDVRDQIGVPVMTDVHEPGQCASVASVVDLLQIPAFLCRQTDLLLAAAATGKPVNVKKGQFLAPWDTKNIVDKLSHAGATQIMLCERGVSFGYNTLIVDMTSLPIMRSFDVPVVFDGTHSVQQPGGMGTSSGGRREFIPYLVRAAVATGCVDALFLEVHPDPANALSDAATMLPLGSLEALLSQVVRIREAIK
jgi:2-dehydro-3-deoxyphosphooctonate aldolase (KDO 8-P synthase)